MTYVIVSSGHLRGLRGLHGLGASNPPAIAAALAQAEQLVDRLNDQRLRIAAEIMPFKAATKLPNIFALLNKVGIIEFDARINTTDELIRLIENFVGDIYNKLYAKVNDPSIDEKTRLATAQRLVSATTNILRAVGDTSPIDDFSAEIGEAVNGVLKDTKDLTQPNKWDIPVWAYGLGILAGLYYVSSIAKNLK